MIEFGDCRDIMRRWAVDGVQVRTCVTSPPYFGLRDYGHEGQIGLEQTPEEYIAAMVEVFRCVRDVLAEDGTLWVNIGDSYANPGHYKGNPGSGKNSHAKAEAVNGFRHSKAWPGAKNKDLIGIPWMLAFALRADGWYLRQDIIWHKPNPMPESVRDRCTKSHEYIFLLSKSERYFFDSEAMKETTEDGFRNRRSVWSVATRPYKGAHFATFPPALIEPCILAGSQPGDLVLDPFMGSGTTAEVALKNGRRYLGCELNPDYKALQDKRIDGATNLFGIYDIRAALEGRS